MRLIPHSESGSRALVSRFVENAVAGATGIAIFAGVAAIFRTPLTPVITTHPLAAAVGAVAIGVFVALGGMQIVGVLRRGRRSTITIKLPEASGEETRRLRIPVIPTDQLSWDDFLSGIRFLNDQIRAQNWEPDLVVAVNQGDAVIGLLRSNERLVNAQFGSMLLDKDRKCRSVALPQIESESEINVLLVDYQLKKGTAIAAVRARLKETFMGTPIDVRLAVMVLGQISRLPVDIEEGHALSSEAFRPAFEGFTAEARGERVLGLHYLAFLCRHYPKTPWADEGTSVSDD